MDKCGWCSHELKGKPVSYTEGPLLWTNGEVTEVIWNGFSVDLCCYGCAWAFGAEIHRLYAVTGGKELRHHLIEKHDLPHPPGKPRGVMSFECHARFKAISAYLVRTFDLGNNTQDSY